ncbi:MAG: mechanosensitive ion channel family protein [Bdellovibrionales bacterium]
MDDLFEDSKHVAELIQEQLVTYGPKVVLAIVVAIVGFFLINKCTAILLKGLEKKDFDKSLRIYLGKILSMVLKILLLVSVAGMLGVNTFSFVAVLGAAGLAVGLALQGSLSNFAGGILLLIFRPFKVGDYVLAQGEEGTVTAIDVLNTTLTKLDNRRVILPNGALVGGNITNVSAEPIRRVDVKIGVGYNDSIPKAMEVLTGVANDNPSVISDPAPFVGVLGFGDSSVDLAFRSWCKQEDYWKVYFELHAKTKEALDANGISIPYPQRDVHIHNK